MALNISQDFLSAGVSGMDNTELILECPYGGCGFLYHKSLAPFVTRVQCNSKCFCALSLALCGPCGDCILSTLPINVYLPTDYGTSDSNNAFLESLGELDGFISMQSSVEILMLIFVGATTTAYNFSRLCILTI